MTPSEDTGSETLLEAAGHPVATAAPKVLDHELVRRIGQGSYGEVWLARNAIGTLRAVKLVFRSRFKDDRPYEREFSGIQKYEPISRSNEGLVDVLQIGRNDAEGYFYYVMELADDAGNGIRTEGVHEKRSEGAVPGIFGAQSSASAFTQHAYVPKTLASEIRGRGRLSVEECVTLGLNLNLALGHLHRHGLIHRDVKPSNIIFVSGVPKLADIGLVVELAEAQSFVGTEGFIPPEGPNSPQADLYALGKVLYEASMGKDRHDFPEPYSGVGTDPDAKALMELNAILLKACAPAARDRYRSAEEMNADLALLHSGQSVQQKQVLQRRVKVLTRVGVALAAVLVLAAFPYYLAITEGRAAKLAARKEADQRRIAEQNEKKAQAETAKSRQIADFLERMLQGVGPSVALGRDTTILREILDQTVASLNTNFVNQPDVEADLRGVVGGVYLDLGQPDRAEAMFRVRLSLLQSLGESNSEQLIRTSIILTHALLGQSRLAEAEQVARHALALLDRQQLTNTDLHGLVLDAVAQALLAENKFSQAENFFRRALEIEGSAKGDHLHLIGALNNLSIALERQGKFAEAEPLQRHVVELVKETSKHEDADTARAIDNLAKIRQALGKSAEAEELMREALRIRRKVLPEGHPDIGLGLHNLADILMDQGQFQEAEKLMIECVQIKRSPLALASSFNNLGAAQREQGKFGEAEQSLREALKIDREALPAHHPEIAVALNNLISVLRKQHKTAEVEGFAREALAIREEQIPDDWRTFNSKAVLGVVLFEEKKYRDAEPFMLAGHEGLKQRFDKLPSYARRYYRESAEHLVQLYEATEQADQVRLWKEQVAEVARQIESAGKP